MTTPIEGKDYCFRRHPLVGMYMSCMSKEKALIKLDTPQDVPADITMYGVPLQESLQQATPTAPTKQATRKTKSIIKRVPKALDTSSQKL